MVVWVGVLCGAVSGGPLPTGLLDRRAYHRSPTCDVAFTPPSLFLGAAPAALVAGGSQAVCHHPARLGMARRQEIRPRPTFLALSMSSNDDATEEERLREEMASILGKSGRDIGMRAMKAPKGSLANLRSRVPKSSSSPAEPPPVDIDSSRAAASPPDAVLPAPTRPGATPPVARPAPRSHRSQPPSPKPAPRTLIPKPPKPPETPNPDPQHRTPDPTYADLDTLMSGKTLAPPPPRVPPPSLSGPPLTAVKPSYAADAGAVTLDGLVAGDAAPDAWAALEGSDGESLSLATLSGFPLVLIIPEPAHHTGAASDSWTKLLIDVQNKLGSARSDQTLTPKPRPQSLNPKSQTLNPKPHTLNPKP